MKIYNRSCFFRGIVYLFIAVLSGIRGAWAREALCVFMALAWAGLAVLELYRATNEKWAGKSQTASARSKAAARKLFGKWWLVVQLFGVVLVVLALALALVLRESGIPVLLMLGGLLYTVVILDWITSKME